MKYAFNLCYQDKNTDSTLYLEVVKDKNGKIMNVKQLDNEIALDILGVKDKPVNDIDKAEKEYPANKDATFVVVMDGTQIIESYGITAVDLTKDKLVENIKNWSEQCDKKQGTYILKIKTTSGYTTYIYYNGGGRYLWNMSVDNDEIYVDLYSDAKLSTTDGYYLMYFTASKEYANINIYLDGKELAYETSSLR